MERIHKRVSGIDVHRMTHVITVIIENADATVTKHTRELSGFKRDMKTLVAWLLPLEVELAILESAGIKLGGVVSDINGVSTKQ